MKRRTKADPTLRFGLHLRDWPCKVIKVYDGDSVTVVWPRERDLGEHRTQYANARLYGIDTPEMTGTSGQTKADALACKEAMTKLALGHKFLMTTIGPTGMDKYGRPLVVLRSERGFTDDAVCNELSEFTSLNDWALRRLPGCVSYFGGTKQITAERTHLGEQNV
jgi:endonuclease YncB( thermonuclease family)